MRFPKIGSTIFIITLLVTGKALVPLYCLAWFCTPQAQAQSSNNLEIEADRLLRQGVEQGNAKQFKAALQSFQQALTIYRQVGNRRREGIVSKNIGNLYFIRGEYELSIKYQQRSLAIAKFLGDSLWEAQSLNNIGLAYAGKPLNIIGKARSSWKPLGTIGLRKQLGKIYVKLSKLKLCDFNSRVLN